MRTLCERFPDDYWAERDEKHEFPWDFYNAIAEAGWLGLTIPEEYGGGGQGVTEAAIVEREIAASGAGMGGCSSVHIGIFGFEPILHHGSEDLKQALPAAGAHRRPADLVRGHRARRRHRHDQPLDVRDEGRRRLVDLGKKVWISNAAQAERMLLLARTTPKDQCAKKTDGLTVFFAEMDREKVTIRRIPKMGRNSVDSNELFIDDLFVADEDVVGEVGKGFKVILTGLNAERVIAANAMLGIGEAALRRGTRYAKERVVFGRPIGQNQGIAFQLAEAKIRLEAADAVLQKATWMVDQQLPCGAEANYAKWLCAEAGYYVRGRGAAGARRHGLQQGVPRRALLPGGPPDADRADQPGDGPQLRRRARARPAAELLTWRRTARSSCRSSSAPPMKEPPHDRDHR